MVAEARHTAVGDEVGYHIGYSRVVATRSKIVFKTSGVLLEEMRDRGLSALTKYNIVILDEVHERSVESDMVLVCVKQFLLRNRTLRVVLMSATADINRYRDYFKDLGRNEKVEVIAIPNHPQQLIFQRQVLYLEQVIELIGKHAKSLSGMEDSAMTFFSDDAEIKERMHELISDLVVHVHKSEPDIKKSILVFLPTYRALELQWLQLRSLEQFSFEIHILHSSIDTEQSLKAMQVSMSHRKVILATNIAESSVTIPGVAFVIDSCRSLQIFWDDNRKRDVSELVWVSKSQADQRKGRTGRTCDGMIYRLVSRSFYSNLEEFERPALLRLSLRKHVLMICCSGSKAINDPKALMQKALDPPNPEIVEDALGFLVRIHALEKSKSSRGRYEPTFYGRLLGCLPLSFDASVLSIKFGASGMLREGILLGIMMDVQPLPVHYPFGEHQLFAEHLEQYFKYDSRGIVSADRKELLLMGNLCAFEFWMRVFKDKQHLDLLNNVLSVENSKATVLEFPNLEVEWCSFHNLVPTSLHAVAEAYEAVLSSMHRYRPQFLAVTHEPPTYYEPHEFMHICLLQSKHLDGVDAGPTISDLTSQSRKCVASPFVGSMDFCSSIVAEQLKKIVKEIRIQFSEDTPEQQPHHVNSFTSFNTGPQCKFFINGGCNRGSLCPFSHSHEAMRPLCKFFLSLEGCRYGESCYFSHSLEQNVMPLNLQYECLPEEADADTDAYSLMEILLPDDGRSILILDNSTELYFSANLSNHFSALMIIATSSLSGMPTFDGLDNVEIVGGVHDIHKLVLTNQKDMKVSWKKVQKVLWFAEFFNDEDTERQRQLVQKFFESFAIRMLADALLDIRVILIMNNNKFAHLRVEKLGRDCFFFLTESFPFDEASFGAFQNIASTSGSLAFSRTVSYVFDLHPPSDMLFGDYSSMLRKGLYCTQ
ncbi:DExH-box ATP-dependent RNA helicase DExH8 isoform X2 [Nymphaea colorata]|nr:DExH-box ATP-dependent RNA helicase DExH8 isoform X2 [Nymphaea colorata]XP_049936136.1 DExH-box ATP-dependent RNA helicase DExH8 isoform X2 [Nymphaea colorata]